MRKLTPFLVLGALALATPALALTVQPTPTRDQAPHLNQTRGAAAGVDLRDSLAAGGRPQAGVNFTGTQGDYSRTQTFSFGSVTTTVTTGRQDLRDYRPTLDAPFGRGPDLLPPRRR